MTGREAVACQHMRTVLCRMRSLVQWVLYSVFLFRLCFPCQACSEPWPASALLASSSSASLTCPWAMGGPVLCPRLCQQPCWFLRCILFPAEADCLSLFRVPFGLGPARSSWVPWARPSQYGAHQAAPELRDITLTIDRWKNLALSLETTM